MNKLIVQTVITFFAGALLLGLLLFLPAGTFNYWQAWVFIAVFMVTISVFGLYFSIKDPELIERRKRAGPGAENPPCRRSWPHSPSPACSACSSFPGSTVASGGLTCRR